MADQDSLKSRWREWIDQLFSDDDQKSWTRLLKEAADQEMIHPDTVKIIHGALHMAEMRVRDVMVPRAKMVCIKLETSRAEILKQISKTQHTRFPVIGDDLNDVRGILHAKDLIINVADNNSRNFDVAHMLRTPSLIPESRRLNALLRDFRSTHRHMAIVVNEFGDTAGLVTIEDVLEQIVGDIEDEHDQESDEGAIVEIEENKYRVRGDTMIGEFNEFFTVDLSEEEFDTLGGIVTQEFGRVPDIGDRTTIASLEFEVINADNRKVTLMHVIKR